MTNRPTYTTGEAARQIGVCKATLRKWVADGIVASLRMPSGYLRFTPEQIEAARSMMAQPVPAGRE